MKTYGIENSTPGSGPKVLEGGAESSEPILPGAVCTVRMICRLTVRLDGCRGRVKGGCVQPAPCRDTIGSDFTSRATCS